MSAKLTIQYAGESRSFEIPENRGFYIGRAGSSLSMRINHPSISRIHAKIEKKDGEWTITDLGSRNGTVVNGDKVTVAAIESGDEIRLGKLKAVFQTDLSKTTRAAPRVVREVTGAKARRAPAAPTPVEARRAPAVPTPVEAEPLERLPEAPLAKEEREEDRGPAPAEKKPEEARPAEEEEDLDEELGALALDEEGEEVEGKTEIEARKKPPEEKDEEEEEAPEDKEEEEDTGPQAAASAPPQEAPAPPEPEAPAAPRRSKGILYAGVFAAAACGMAAFLYLKGLPGPSTPPEEGPVPIASINGTGPADGDPALTTVPANLEEPEDPGNEGQPKDGLPSDPDDVLTAANNVLKGDPPISPATGDDDDDEPGGGLAQTTPTVQAAGKGAWASLSVAFFDFQRAAEGLDSVTAASVEKAIAALPAEKREAAPVIRMWLKKRRHEWKFAGAKAADLADDPSFAPDLLQAAQAAASDPESISKANSLPALALKAITRPLEKYASVAMTAALFGAASSENERWAAEVLTALRRRFPDDMDRVIRDHVLALDLEGLEATVPFMSSLGAWGSELGEKLIEVGLKSDDRATQLRFIETCKKLELKEYKNQLVTLMNSASSSKVKTAAKEALVAMGEMVEGSSGLDKLVQQFVHGSDEDRKKVFATAEAAGQREGLQKALSEPIMGAAADFFAVLRDAGRERVLDEFYHSESPIVTQGSEKAFEQQLEYEKFGEDYRGVWPEHVWLLENAAAVGLLPKNREIVQIMAKGQIDEFGQPSWFKNGPIMFYKPEGGEWKIYAVMKLDYAFRFSKTLRRHKEEMEESEK